MKVSYEWLQSYFDADLPKPEELAEVLTFHSFEIEEVKQVGSDFVIDIDVLPNRSSDCLSHRGIARELATLLELEMKDDPLKKHVTSAPDSNILEVGIQSPELVNRFSAAVVSGIEVGESPAWLRKRLETIGQKSINNVVDATNYVMFDVGQPLHAFDRDKLSEKDGGYTISVRVGKSGEKITVLTGEEYEVGKSNLLIIDGNSDTPIGIAGVKGGKSPEVDKTTKNLIIEAANFNYVSVRKTSQALRLRTDASTRFENEPSPELTLYALRDVVELVGGTLEGFADYYPNPKEQKPVAVSVGEINNLLGTSISAEETGTILKRFDFEYAKNDDVFTVTPPFERTDLNIKEDLIEEVGRVYGYEHIRAEPLPEPKEKPAINKRFYYAEKMRQFLVERGFSEVYTYSLQKQGDVELANPLAKDRPFLRRSLADGLRESLVLNARNVDLLGLEKIQIFEIGTVFGKDGEHTALGIGIVNAKGKADNTLLEEVTADLASRLEASLPSGGVRDGVWEINFAQLIESLPEPTAYDTRPPDGQVSYDFNASKTKKFEPISPYPFVLRDIAVWVPAKTSSDEVMKMVKKEAEELLVNSRLFDTYEPARDGTAGGKDDRISYAFRLVFQSHEKTLSDDEINEVMERISRALHAQNWNVR